MNWLVLVCFFVGLLSYMALKAQAVANSTLNGFPRGWRGVPSYFGHYVVLLMVRAISNFGILVLILFGGEAARADFLPTILATNPYVLAVLAYFVGLGMDAALEKFQDRVPWLKAVIPPPPPAPLSNGALELDTLLPDALGRPMPERVKLLLDRADQATKLTVVLANQLATLDGGKFHSSLRWNGSQWVAVQTSSVP